MLTTQTIQQIAATAPDVYAFRIRGEVAAEDLQAMAKTINAAFDVQPAVSMLLIFDHYEGVETGAGFDLETVTSQFRSLAKVEKYAVVGAPRVASVMINVMDKVIPTDARTFEADEEPLAWAFVGARPTA
jgi:SpoIIAA-like